MKRLEWTNHHNIDLNKGAGFLYYVQVDDPGSGRQFRYVGKSSAGEGRLRAYRRNVERIFAGLPRRSTPGQQRYRAVHLALAKACAHGWQYRFYPIANASLDELNRLERESILARGCNLNVRRSWAVDEFATLTLATFLAEASDEKQSSPL